jgi:hypothetical protein
MGIRLSQGSPGNRDRYAFEKTSGYYWYGPLPVVFFCYNKSGTVSLINLPVSNLI